MPPYESKRKLTGFLGLSASWVSPEPRSLPAIAFWRSSNFFCLSARYYLRVWTSVRILSNSVSVIPSYQFSHFLGTLGESLTNSMEVFACLGVSLLPVLFRTALPGIRGLFISLCRLLPLSGYRVIPSRFIPSTVTALFSVLFFRPNVTLSISYIKVAC